MRKLATQLLFTGIALPVASVLETLEGINNLSRGALLTLDEDHLISHTKV
jgi:hypothetical protein